MSSVDECAGDYGDSDGALGLRIGALFGILVASAIGICIPFVCSIADLTAISFVRAFAGGVVIATGFVHILGDAQETLADPCLGWPDFPWAMSIATFATLFTFNFEWVIHRAYTHYVGGPVPCCGVAAPLPLATGEATHAHARADVLVEEGRTSTAGASSVCHDGTLNPQATSGEYGPLSKGGQAIDALARSVQACTLEAGIVFHSVFIGLALGITRDRAEVRALMVALMFHQLNEGIAIGILQHEARYGTRKYWLLGALFFLTTPVAIGIGIGVSASYNPNSKSVLGTQGVLDAVSAGILLYNALVDFIVPTFNNDVVFKTMKGKAAGFACLYLGAGVMCLIAKWA